MSVHRPNLRRILAAAALAACAATAAAAPASSPGSATCTRAPT